MLRHKSARIQTIYCISQKDLEARRTNLLGMELEALPLVRTKAPQDGVESLRMDIALIPPF